jgi:hypothetical protein
VLAGGFYTPFSTASNLTSAKKESANKVIYAIVSLQVLSKRFG